MTLDKRMKRLEDMDFAYGDEFYRIIDDFVIQKYLTGINEHFGVSHSVIHRGGAGMTSSDTSALEVRAPRMTGNGFVKFFSPSSTVIKVNLRYGRIQHNEHYQEFANKIAEEYSAMFNGKLDVMPFRPLF